MARAVANLMLTANGDVPGCILLDWQSGPASGTWDVHWRMEHTAHTLWNIHGAGAGGVLENSCK